MQKLSPKQLIHFGGGVLAMVVTLITYLWTMQPSVSYWDCGELAAAAWGLQIPHPPGAPLWTLLGRLAILLPTFSDPVARLNFLSVLSSTISIGFLYFSAVRVLNLISAGENERLFHIVRFSAFVAAVSLIFSDSFWFNALESEVYALATLFMSCILWLGLYWFDIEDTRKSNQLLLVIAYLIGLSLGVHQLGLLMIFPIALLIGCKYYQPFNWKRVLITLLIALVPFIISYTIILTKLVKWIGSGQWYLAILAIVLFTAIAVYSFRAKRHLLQLVALTVLFIGLGYTTNVLTLLRANQHPPLNEGDPSTLADFSSYLNREQYGEGKIFPRRIPELKDQYKTTWSDYESDLEFLWKYQINLMYTRYLAWNFIGRDGNWNGAGIALGNTFALPLLLGFLGLIYHLRKDKSLGVIFLLSFLLLGVLTALVQNQQEPQPRERDYFYVGSFYLFAIWIGVGSYAILQFLKDRLHTKTASSFVIASVGGLLLLVGPVNQCLGLGGLMQGKDIQETSKWYQYSRKDNVVPFEYAYNLLQSCNPNAILFTAGDNDTFPLWCLQSVYGIRRDIRIVQLSLSTTPWYLKQLKEKQWNADALNLPELGQAIKFKRGINWLADQIQYGSEEVTIDNNVRWQSTIATTSDWVIIEIVKNNITKHPIYFSDEIAEEQMAGLDRHIQELGLASQISFQANTIASASEGYEKLKTLLLSPSQSISTSFVPTYQLTGYTRGATLNYLDQKYAGKYQNAYIQLISQALMLGKPSIASEALDSLKVRLPLSEVSIGYPYASILATLSRKLHRQQDFESYASVAIHGMKQAMASPDWPNDDKYAKLMNVKFTLASLYRQLGKLDSAKLYLEQLADASQGDIQQYYLLRLKEIEGLQMETKGDLKGAIFQYDEVLRELTPPDGVLSEDLLELKARRDSLAQRISGQF